MSKTKEFKINDNMYQHPKGRIDGALRMAMD